MLLLGWASTRVRNGISAVFNSPKPPSTLIFNVNQLSEGKHGGYLGCRRCCHLPHPDSFTSASPECTSLFLINFSSLSIYSETQVCHRGLTIFIPDKTQRLHRSIFLSSLTAAAFDAFCDLHSTIA
ncbi:hypothetical protein PM082_001794 [Marasmius tenuissimus]|nr:hypothetical protein PM082_001794 [Marasmius tenuissimus]